MRLPQHPTYGGACVLPGLGDGAVESWAFHPTPAETPSPRSPQSALSCICYALLHLGAGRAISSVLICFPWRACTSRLGWPAGPPRSSPMCGLADPEIGSHWLLDLAHALAGCQCSVARPNAFPGGNPGCLGSTPAWEGGFRHGGLWVCL